MPRNIPSTSWGDRTPPTTSWDCDRCLDFIRWDTTEITFDTTEFTFDVESTWWLITDWEEPRYDLYVEDVTWANVQDLLWNDVTWVSWDETNKIDTPWT